MSDKDSSLIEGLKKGRRSGVSAEIHRSIALFMYIEYETGEFPETITIFNQWIEKSGYRIHEIDHVVSVLELIRKLKKTERRDLKESLELDGLIG